MFLAQIDSLIAVYPEINNLVSDHNLPLIIVGICLAVSIQWAAINLPKTKFGKSLIDSFKNLSKNNQPTKSEPDTIKKEVIEKKEK